MRMGRLIVRFPFERTGISPPGPNSTARWPGRCRAIAADDQQGQDSPTQEAGPRVAIPSRRPRKVAMATLKIGRRPLSTATPVVLNATIKGDFNDSAQPPDRSYAVRRS